MTDSKEKFRCQTIDALNECAVWIESNVAKLADLIVNDDMGCKSWSLTFSFDPERYPSVMVDTDCKHVDTLNGTYD